MEGKPTETDDIETIAQAESGPSSASPPSALPPAGVLSVDADDPLLRDIVAALKTVYDPEIPADIYELGLVYSIDMSSDGVVTIDMTLTAPGCPVAGDIVRSVENAISTVGGVSGVKVNLVFDPPWDQSRMSDEARLTLNMW